MASCKLIIIYIHCHIHLYVTSLHIKRWSCFRMSVALLSMVVRSAHPPQGDRGNCEARAATRRNGTTCRGHVCRKAQQIRTARTTSSLGKESFIAHRERCSGGGVVSRTLQLIGPCSLLPRYFGVVSPPRAQSVATKPTKCSR